MATSSIATTCVPGGMIFCIRREYIGLENAAVRRVCHDELVARYDDSHRKVIVNYLDHISRDPNICGGAPVIRGTRVTLRTLLASLAEGCEDEEILRNFPAVTKEDLRAVIAFAAASAISETKVRVRREGSVLVSRITGTASVPLR